MQGLPLERQPLLCHVCFTITAVRFKVKQDLNLNFHGADRQATWKKRVGEEETWVLGGKSCQAAAAWLPYCFAGLWLVSSQKVFSHTLRTLIKRVISVCAGLRGHFNQVEPVEVWIRKAGEVRVSSGEVSWLSTKRHRRTTEDKLYSHKCPGSSKGTAGRNQRCQHTGHGSASLG